MLKLGIIKLGLFLVVSFFITANVVGQGHGHGGGMGNSGGRGGGPPSGVGVDRGLGNASSNSGGRSDGLGNASDRSNGRSDAGLDRARLASDNMRRADEDLRDHPGIPSVVHTNANSLRNGYQAALSTNPNLKFGQYVAATRLSQNLGSRFPGVTRTAILSGLASGRSLGQTLQDLGLSEKESKAARKTAEREINDARH